jgi:uncharacterized protein (TIGR00251 family)
MAGVRDFYSWQGNDLLLRIRLQPRASGDEIVGVQDGALKIRITAPPVDGKANDHLVRYLAKVFDVSASRVTLVFGHKGKDKRVLIKAPARLPAFIPEIERRSMS